jgi:lipopolysaccharide transport system permease protein
MDRLAVEANPTAPPRPASAGEDVVERVIVPAKSRLKLRDLYRDIPVVRVLAGRDFKVKYKQSLLGPLWLVIQPLALLLAFFVAFRSLADVQTAGIPYALFALTGLCVWAFFQAAMTMGTASLISNYHLVRLTPCPRLAFPVASLVASLPALAITVVATLLVAIVLGELSPRVLLLPIAAAWLFLFTAGVVALSSAITVRFRDMLNILPFLLQVGVFVSPVGYPRSALGPNVQWIVDLNPLTGIIETWRWMVLPVESLPLRPVAISIAETALLLVFGWFVFSRLEVKMADEI